MDRLVSPLVGYYPTHPSWDFIWQSMMFCPDFVGWPPESLGGYATWPYAAAPVRATYPQQTDCIWGPATTLPNANNSNWSQGWYWNAVQGNGENDFTLALGWSHEVSTSGWLRLLYLESTIYGIWHLLEMSTTGYYRWSDLWNSAVTSYPVGWSQSLNQLVVITVRYQTEMRIYANGKLVALENPWGYGGMRLSRVYLACGSDKKQNQCVGGRMGPLLICKGVWTPGQVAQWCSDPYGFMRPAWHPIPYVIGCPDGLVETELASDGLIETGMASEGVIETELAADGIIETELAADGIIETALASDGMVETCQRGHA